jgi:hypothetical protein
MTALAVDVNCDVPCQCECIDEHENYAMATHDLKEDAKFFSFITTFGRDAYNPVYRKWPSIRSNGYIMQFPLVYFYFIRYTYYENGMRSIKVGFICWVRGIYATIDIDFHVYPEKSVYVDPEQAWRLPYSEATYRVEIFNADKYVTRNPMRYVHSLTTEILGVIRMCANHDVKEIRRACNTHASTYPSYRLANILVYQQKLVSKVRSFMILKCCSSFKTTANISYCGCETLCSETIPEHFVDVEHMCGDVLFSDSSM